MSDMMAMRGIYSVFGGKKQISKPLLLFPGFPIFWIKNDSRISSHEFRNRLAARILKFYHVENFSLVSELSFEPDYSYTWYSLKVQGTFQRYSGENYQVPRVNLVHSRPCPSVWSEVIITYKCWQPSDIKLTSSLENLSTKKAKLIFGNAWHF